MATIEKGYCEGSTAEHFNMSFIADSNSEAARHYRQNNDHAFSNNNTLY